MRRSRRSPAFTTRWRWRRSDCCSIFMIVSTLGRMYTVHCCALTVHLAMAGKLNNCPPIFIRDLLELRRPREHGSFLFRGKEIYHVSIMGMVVDKLKYRHERFRGFIVDDGTGTVICSMDIESSMFQDAMKADELYEFYRRRENCPSRKDRVTLTGMIEPILEVHRNIVTVKPGDVINVHGKPILKDSRILCIAVSSICPVESVEKEIQFIEAVNEQMAEILIDSQNKDT